jgi:hypothetical protein
MEDIVKSFGLQEGYFMELVDGNTFAAKPRHYRHYECHKCGLFLMYRHD